MKSNIQRARNAIFFIWLFLGVQVICAISNISQYYLLKELIAGNRDNDAILRNNFRNEILTILGLIVLAGSAITFIRWFQRAYSNLGTKVPRLNYTNALIFGAWFVPIVNFYLPYKIMKELYFKTEFILEREGLLSGTRSRILTGSWWTMCIIYAVSANITGEIISHANTLEDQLFGTQLSIALCLLFIPLCIVTVRMIRDYTRLGSVLTETTGTPQMPDDDEGLKKTEI